MNCEKFVLELAKPLVVNADVVVVKTLIDKDDYKQLQILVAPEDLGRIIGRKGRIANAIRTIVHACAARHGFNVDILIDSISE